MAGDRLQIVLAAKDEITQELKQVKSEFKSLERTSIALNKRMQAGEQGLQDEYEQTRLQLNKNIDKQQELGRAASKVKSELREMTTDGTAGAKRLDRSFDGVNRTMGKTQTAAGKMTVGWGKMMGAVAVVTGAVASLSGAFRFLSDSINEARGARKALAQTEAVLRSMGRKETAESIEKMLDDLSRMSGIDDDNLREMSNTLLTFGNVTGDTFTKANELALDVSAAFDKDLRSSAVMVGKALNDPIKGLTALTRVGVSFTAQQSEKIKSLMEEGRLAKAQKIILGELTRQVEGSAAAQADGIDRMGVAWGNLKESIGETLLSVSTGSFDAVAAIESMTDAIKRNKKQIVSALQDIISWVFTLASVWLKVASVWLRAESVIINTVGYVIGAVAKLAGVLEFLGIVEEGTSERIGEMADGLREAGDTAGNTSKKFNDQAKHLGDLGESMRLATRRTNELREGLRRIKDKKVRIDVRTTLNDAFTAVDEAVSRANDLPGAAMGGPVFGPTVVGELGPELFVPKIGAPRVIGADGPEIRDFRQSGTVVPNHLLATVTLPKQAQPAGYVGPPVQIGTINATQGVDVENAILRAQMRADRIARERR